MVFSRFFIGAKHTAKSNVFGAFEAKNQGICDGFCPWEQKSTMSRGLRLTNTSIYAVFSVLHEVVFLCESCKNIVDYSTQKTAQIDQKVSKVHLRRF